ncbi:hypothetical protein GC177_06995 [bacterium]|nr:hypothetical protein [bacterium]
MGMRGAGGSNMLRLVLILVFSLMMNAAFAQSLASCSSPKGHAYYQFQGLVQEKDKGWTEDQISSGLFELKSTQNGYDILYIDATKQMSSTKGDGGRIILLNQSSEDAVFLISYPGNTSEIYRFFKEKDGAYKFAVISIKTRLIPKNSLMVGECSYINFQGIK